MCACKEGARFGGRRGGARRSKGCTQGRLVIYKSVCVGGGGSKEHQERGEKGREGEEGSMHGRHWPVRCLRAKCFFVGEERNYERGVHSAKTCKPIPSRAPLFLHTPLSHCFYFLLSFLSPQSLPNGLVASSTPQLTTPTPLTTPSQLTTSQLRPFNSIHSPHSFLLNPSMGPSAHSLMPSLSNMWSKCGGHVTLGG